MSSESLLQEIAGHIVSNHTDINYAQMLRDRTQLLAVGEEHTGRLPKIEFTRNLTTLERLGFTHLGMEMFESSFQPVLDEYQNTGARREEVLNHLREGYGRWTAHNTDLYMRIVDSAIGAGIRVLGIDRRHGPDSAELNLTGRDPWMADTILPILQDPTRRVVTYTGSDHSSKGVNSMASLVGGTGIDVVSVSVRGIDDLDYVPEHVVAGVDYIGIMIEALGLGDRRLMFPVNTKLQELGMRFDWIVRLPV